jgi:arylsulfatase A-like enzyme
MLLSCLALLCAPGAPAWGPPAAFAAGGPDAVVFVLDDMSVFDLAGLPLPGIDALAARGVVFERAYGMPVCHPARRALLSGEVWPQRHGSIPCDPGPFLGPQVGDLPLPELFRAAGFRTAGFGKWHLGEDPTSPDWPRAPFAHGFDHWRAGIPANVELCGGRNYRRWARMEEGVTYLSGGYHTSVLVDSFLGWWPYVRGPRMAWVAFQSAHQPFHRPPPELLPPGWPPTPDTRSMYEAMIVSADTALGQMLAGIDLARTVVVLVGDNGTPETVSPDPAKAKQTTFERGIHVPMIIAGPGIRPGVCRSVVHLVDVFETLRELCGLDRSAPARDAVSLVPCLRDPAQRPRPYAYVQLEEDLAVVSARFKLREAQGVQSFYDLELDPLEEHPIPPGEPRYRKELAIHRAWLEENRR